nr:hypothetical protein [Tanacetum cinerariifolium]
MIESSLMDSGFVVPVFSPGDDPIACLNKAMAFLTTIASLRNAAWYKEKAMLTEAQKAGQILDEEQLAFLADLGVPDGQAIQTIIPNNAAFQTEDLDTYDSDGDDISNAQAVLMDNISNYGFDVISEEKANKEQHNKSVTAELERYKERVKTLEECLNIDLRSREKIIDSQMDDTIREKLALKEQVDSLKPNLSKQINEKECLLQTFIIFKSESKEKEDKYMENEIDLEKKIKELDNILFKVGQSNRTVHMLTKPQAFNDNIHKQALRYQNPFHLKKAQRIKPTCMMTVFDQMDVAVQQPLIDKQCLEIAKKELLLENDRLLQQIMSQDVLLTVINSMSLLGESVNVDEKIKESCNIEAELLESQNAFNNILKSTICKLKDVIKSMREKSKEENVEYDYGEIETKNVKLENSVAKLILENERLCNEFNHVKQVFKEQFNSIKKTRVRTKEQSDSLINKLNLKSAKNEDLKAQIQDKVFVIKSLKNDLKRIKGEEIIDMVAQKPSANTIVPGMFKLDLEPLAYSLL